MALNEGLAWTSADVSVTKAFFDGKAEKVLLTAGTALYKFNTRGRDLVYQGKVSPWWFPVKPIGDEVGLEGVLKFAKTVGVSSTEYARLIAAVTEEWNKMDVIMRIELTQTAHGFRGQCAKQPKSQDSKVNLTGRAYQLWIPNLDASHVKLLGIDKAP